jgi:uroporphyrinogen III methyltransferase/synthase
MMAGTQQVGQVWLVGGGPGDPGLVTQAALDALRQAEVVLYDRLAPVELLDECPTDALLIDAGKAVGRQALTQAQTNATIVEHALAGKRVVRLKGGDPFVFGRGGEEAEACREAGVPCTVISGITSAIGGLAAAGIPITHRGVAASFAVVTGHEDPNRTEEGVHWDRLATAVDTLVVLMGVGNLDRIAAQLIEAGRDADTPCAVIQSATRPEQRVVEAPLREIVRVVEEARIQAPALFVVGDVVRVRSRIASVGGGALNRRRVLITRTRQQASTLADALRAEGARPVLLPAIEVQRRADLQAVDAAVTKLRAGGYQWVVFTSENAVAVMLDLMAERGADARAFAGAQVCAIGAATASALAARGLRADVIAGDQSGEGMLDVLLRSGAGGASVLLPRAEGGRAVLPDGLRTAGASVDEVTLYLAAPPAEAPAGALALIRGGQIDAVTFTSSSTVRNLATLLGGDLSALRGAVIACIGPQTAEAATEAGLPPTVVAAEASVHGLVDALRSHFAAAEEA